MCYLVLPTDFPDFCKWANKPANDICAVVVKNGSITAQTIVREFYQLMNCTVVIFNPRIDHHETLAKLKELVGNTPRIFVHFGRMDSPGTTTMKVIHGWEQHPYHDLFPHVRPMPYSMSSKSPWDKLMQELAIDIKSTLGGGTPVNSQPSGYLNILNNAWALAEQHFKDTDLYEAFKQLQPAAFFAHGAISGESKNQFEQHFVEHLKGCEDALKICKLDSAREPNAFLEKYKQLAEDIYNTSNRSSDR